MIIENITKAEGKVDRFTVEIDDGTEIMVSAVQISDFGLYSGRELAEEEYAQLCEEIAQSRAKARALRILGSRTLSARELEKRLVNKGESVETAQAAVRWLESSGIINDSDYAVSIVQYYSLKGYGAARIKDELFKRGIRREIWDEALECIDDTGDAAQEYLKKKLKGSSDSDDIRRALNSLHARGYSYSEARSAVNRYIGNVDEAGDRYE